MLVCLCLCQCLFQVLSTGYSRELLGNTHAEECCFLKLAHQGRMRFEGATMYTTMEPCSTRLSGKTSCTDLILSNKLSRVVFAVKEPTNFVICTGAATLEQAGLDVVHLKAFEKAALAVNKHIVLTQ